MRVIAGKCRSLPLKTVPGRQTRPTTDRIKETLFNMLQPYLPDARFLDLFAGSGAIGIEALSRGAERAWFVEQNKAAADCIRQNLKFTKLEQQAVLLPMEAHAALQSLQGQEPFDCIFMDPPYDKGLEKDVLYAFRSFCLYCIKKVPDKQYQKLPGKRRITPCRFPGSSVMFDSITSALFSLTVQSRS